jgi:hypothetical protein
MFDSDLEDLEYSTWEPYENVILVADVRSIQVFSRPLFPFFWIFALSILVSLLLPPRVVSTTVSLPLEHALIISEDHFVIHANVTNLSPRCEFLSLSLDFDGIPVSRLPLAGFLEVKRIPSLEDALTFSIPMRTIPVVNNRSGPILLLTDRLLDYSEVRLELTLRGFPISTNTVQFTSRSHRPLTNLAVASIKILISLSLVAVFCSKMSSVFGRLPLTIEQKLTLILLVVTVLYADPLSVYFLFFPSQLHRSISSVMRDVFRAFFGFFALALMARFGRDPESLVSGLAFPYFYLLAAAVILLYSDPGIPTGRNPEILPQTPPVFGHSPARLAANFAVLLACVGAVSGLSYVRVLPTQTARFRFYCLLNFGAIGLEIVVQGSAALFGFLEARAVSEVVSVAAFAGYAIVMSAGHDRGKSASGGEYQIAARSPGADFGVDAAESDS